MSNALVTYERRGPAGWVTLNRPEKRNALSRDLLDALGDALDRARDDAAARLVVLAGAGPVFCAGMDLGEMLEVRGRADAEAQWQADAQRYRHLITKIYTMPKPTLAALGGPALAGGAGFVVACDLVLATPSAALQFPEPMRGIVAGMVSPFLILRAGFGAANYILLTARRITAEEAQQLGVVHEIVPADRLEGWIAELAEDVARCAPGALAETKGLLHGFVADELEQRLRAATQLSAEVRGRAEAKEGLSAFLEKRPPKWGKG